MDWTSEWVRVDASWREGRGGLGYLRDWEYGTGLDYSMVVVGNRGMAVQSSER